MGSLPVWALEPAWNLTSHLVYVAKGPLLLNYRSFKVPIHVFFIIFIKLLEFKFVNTKLFIIKILFNYQTQFLIENKVTWCCSY